MYIRTKYNTCTALSCCDLMHPSKILNFKPFWSPLMEKWSNWKFQHIIIKLQHLIDSSCVLVYKVEDCTSWFRKMVTKFQMYFSNVYCLETRYTCTWTLDIYTPKDDPSLQTAALNLNLERFLKQHEISYVSICFAN